MVFINVKNEYFFKNIEILKKIKKTNSGVFIRKNSLMFNNRLKFVFIRVDLIIKLI